MSLPCHTGTTMEARIVRGPGQHASCDVARAADDLADTAVIESGFAELYVRHRDAVFRLVRRHAANDEEAADLAAGAFEQAFRRLETYDERRGPVLPWLLRIARNHAIDARRRRRPVLSLDRAAERLDPAGDADPEVHVLAAEARADLRSRLARLPLLQQEVLVLRYGNHLTSREIGQVVGKSEAATQKLLARALARLRENLDEQRY